MRKQFLGWADLRRKTMRKRAWRGLNIVVAIATILNVTSVGMLLPQAVLADHTNSTPVSGNGIIPKFLPGASNSDKACNDLDDHFAGGQTWSEFKIDSAPTNGNHDDGVSGRTVTLSNSTSTSFDWASNFGVDAIVVKSGSNGSNIYVYDPPGPESTSDTQLGPPSTQAISHISFCWTDDPIPPTGSLLPHKQVDLNGDGDWEDADEQSDTKADEISFRWGLDSGNITETFGVQMDNLAPGDIKVWENDVTGYEFVGWFKNDGRSTCDTAQLNTDHPVDASIVADETTEITFCNKFVPEPTYSVHGYKWNDYNGNGQQEDEPRLGGWMITLWDGDTQIDSMETCTFTQTQDSNHDCYNHEVGWYWFMGLEQGTYTICEDPQNGWTQTYPLNGNGNCHTVSVPQSQEGDTCQSLDLQISLNAVIENAVVGPMCNFGNQELPTITVHKQVDHDDDGQYDETNPSLADGFAWQLVEDNTPNTWTEFGTTETRDTGTWTVVEDMPAGYHFVGWAFGNPNQYDGELCEEAQLQDGPVEIELNSEDDLHITLCNSSDPTVTVLKNVDEDGDGQVDVFGSTDWTWDMNGGNQNFSTGSTEFVPQGPITLNEDMQDGYEFVSVVCEQNEDPFEVSQDTSVSFEVEAGSHYVCTFTNKKITTPELEIEKSNNAVTFLNPGATVGYTVSVTNVGDAVAEDVVLTDTLPAGFSFVNGSASITPDSVVGQVITWNVGDMNPAEVFTVTYDATISSGQAAGFYLNTAVADGSNVEEVSDDSTVEVRVPIVLGQQNPELELTKTVDPTLTNPGKTVTYTVVLSNPGDGDALNVVLTDTLPQGFTFADDGSGTKTWVLGILPAGTSKTIAYDVLVGNDVTAGFYDNLAVASADDVDPVTAKATVEVRVPQVLGLADTGVSLRDYVIFVLATASMIAGFVLFRRYRRELGLE